MKNLEPFLQKLIKKFKNYNFNNRLNLIYNKIIEKTIC